LSFRLDAFRTSLLAQLQLTTLTTLVTLEEVKEGKFDFVLDGLFGFSFKPPLREEFQAILDWMRTKSNIIIISIDLPSGWHVEDGNIYNQFTPSCLVSLSAPKKGTSDYKGAHYVAGRFIPPSLTEKYSLSVPRYPGSSQFVRL
jgi:NAD(P)H-hydrate epimerase